MSTIEVVCSEPVHDGASVIVFRFSRGESGWIAGSSFLRVGTPRSGKIAGMDAAYGLLDGDRYLTKPERDTGLSDAAGLRARFAFKCDCGLKVTARREKLDPALDALASAGVSRISLRGLAVSIRR